MIRIDDAKKNGIELKFGLRAEAGPGGKITKHAYELIRDDILEELSKNLPVDGILYDLHGAMMAFQYDHCELDLVQRTREIVGNQTPIGVLLDNHCQTSQDLINEASVVITYKESPHTDYLDRKMELFYLVLKVIKGEYQPTSAIFDCKMMGLFPTTEQPLRAFVDRLFELEKQENILSLSVGYGFPYGDSLKMGTKIIAITDDDQELANSLAKKLGRELYGMRNEISPQFYGIEQALTESRKIGEKPVVFADVADNPGGGAGSDSTIMLDYLIQNNISNFAIAMIYDPYAVKMAKNAGIGAKLELRIGGKIGKFSGNPLDLFVEIKAIETNAFQKFRQGSSFTDIPIGDIVRLSIKDIDIILTNMRIQVFGIEPLTLCGIDLNKKDLIIVKSSNHFKDAYSRISNNIFYVSTPGVCSGDYRSFDYQKMDKNRFPFIDDVLLE